MKKYAQTIAMVPFLVTAFLVPSMSFADNLSIPFPCPGGGDITAAGSWNIFSGAVDFSLKSTDCVLKNGETAFVDATTTGIFKIRPENVETDIITHLEATVIAQDGTVLLSGTVDRTIKGEYDLLKAELVDGTFTNNSNWTAKNIPLPVGGLFAIDEIFDDVD